MKDETIIILFALMAITIIEIFALASGIDGALLTAVIGVIAGLAGYKTKSALSK